MTSAADGPDRQAVKKFNFAHGWVKSILEFENMAIIQRSRSVDRDRKQTQPR